LREEPDRETQLELLYLTIYGRSPDPQEVGQLAAYLGDASYDAKRWQQVIWAMLTSAEFQLNH